MKKARNGLQSGFTLVEILIVVVILGILAAIVIPQFTSASESAKSSSLVSQLQTIRSQLELYQVQHNGIYPVDTSSDAFWDQMTKKTDVHGDPIAVGDTTTPSFGPYLQQPSTNPFEQSSDIGTGPGAGTGWVYDAETGAITGVVSTLTAAKVFPSGVPTNDVSTY